MNQIDQGLYQASLKALIEHRVPPKLAAQASEVVASDQVGISRTTEQQHLVTSAWHWMNAEPLEPTEQELNEAWDWLVDNKVGLGN